MHKHSDVGVAVSIPGGLITPIIRKAEQKSLSTDHRAVDGALGAELLGAFKRYIENPMSMLV